MPDVAAILTALREELIDTGLFRRPSDAGGATVYPVHIEPREGAPAPGEREGVEDNATVVLSLFHSGDLAEGGYDAAHRRRTVIDVRYRAASNGALRTVMALDASIRARLIRPETNYGYGFALGTAAPVWTHQAALWGGLGPLGRGRDVAFDHVAKWLFEVAP